MLSFGSLKPFSQITFIFIRLYIFYFDSQILQPLEIPGTVLAVVAAAAIFVLVDITYSVLKKFVEFHQ